MMAGRVPRHRGSPHRLGGRLSRLRLSFAGLGSAGMRWSMGGGLGSGSTGAPRLGRALRASFSSARRSRAGEPHLDPMEGWVEADEVDGFGVGLAEGPLAAGRGHARKVPVTPSADELLGGAVGPPSANPGKPCTPEQDLGVLAPAVDVSADGGGSRGSAQAPDAGLWPVAEMGADGGRAGGRGLGIRVEGLAGAHDGGDPSPDSMSLSRFPARMCAPTRPLAPPNS